MPKKSLVLRDFSSGLITSTHGSDLPDNVLVGGSNHNVNRKDGVLQLSGAFETVQKPDESSNNLETFSPPGNFKGIPGRGLFYFLSDYGGMKEGLDSSDGNFSQDYPAIETAEGVLNWRLGSEARISPTEYYFMGSRHTNYQPIETYPGNTSHAVHIYQMDRAATYQSTPDGTYNGWVMDLQFGFQDNGLNTSADDAEDINNPNYSDGYFPVYYAVKGAVRMCSGKFALREAIDQDEGSVLGSTILINARKLWVGYVRDGSLFNGLTNNVTSTQGNSFFIDNWVIDGGNYSLNDDYYVTLDDRDKPIHRQHGILAEPITESCYRQGNWLRDIDDSEDITLPFLWNDKVYLCMTKSIILGGDEDGGGWITNMEDGESFPALVESQENSDYSNYGVSSELDVDGAIALSLHIKSNKSQSGTTYDFTPEDVDGTINLPKGGWDLWCSYVYDWGTGIGFGGEESRLVKFPDFQPSGVDAYGIESQDNFFQQNGETSLSSQFYGENKYIEATFRVKSTVRRHHPRVKGLRLYITSDGNDTSGETDDFSNFNLVAEMNFEEGCRPAGTLSYNPWQNCSTYSSGVAGSYFCKATITVLGNETFSTLHGYPVESIKPCYYKTAVVTNNRVYAGNVRFDGELFPDRMIKSQVGEYDTFTSTGFIDVVTSDADSIVHLEVYGEKLLQFKENSVYILNISKEFEVVESSHRYAGVRSPSQVTQGGDGVYWVSKKGLYHYDGTKVINLLDNSRLNIYTGDITVSSSIVSQVVGDWSDVISETLEEEPVISYNPIKKEIIIVGQSSTDISFVWNTEKKTLAQLFGKSDIYTKSNSITTLDGDAKYLQNTAYNADFSAETAGGKLKKWNSAAQDHANDLNLLLLTKAIDFGNHAQRKVIESISFTYLSNGTTTMVPYIVGYFLDGTAPSTFYVALSNTTGITGTDVEAEGYAGVLPDTTSKYETFKYKHVLSSNVTGSAVSMRSKLKNVGAIQIGLVKLDSSSSTLQSEFELEEISITYRAKNNK